MSVWKDKKRGTWIAKFRHNKKPYKKEGFKTKSAAREWEHQKRQELQNPHLQIHSISFQELATKYLEHCQARFQKNTWRAKSHYYRTFQAFIQKDTPIDHILRSTYTEYLNQIAKSQGTKTANRHLKDLNALFNWAIKNDYIFSNPVKNIEKFGEDEHTKYVPPIEDIDKVMLVASGD